MTTDQQPLSVPIPEHITMEQKPEGFALSYRWFSFYYVFLAVFCLIWDGFLVFWYSLAFTQNAPWIMFAFPVLHIATGIGVTYYTLAGFYNRTVITVGMGKITIQHTPLPWPGNRTITAADLIQLYSEERIVQSNNSTRATFQLSAISTQNKKVKLLSGLNSRDEVRFLEHKIEEQLGITDRPVEGDRKSVV
jgi:hypothetical protein